jgi:hypothetical protein
VTLVLSYANPSFCLQVSDRLVTDSADRDPLDPAANKTIVYRATNALVSLSYSGLALIGSGSDQRATDHWLVEHLVGQGVEQAANLGLGPGDRDLGHALRTLCTALNASPHFRRRFGIEMTFCGFQWRRDQRRPARFVDGALEHRDGAFTFSVSVNRSGEGLRGSLVVSPKGHGVDGNALLKELWGYGPRNPDTVEARLVEVIRGRNEPTVGRDCMSVLIRGADDVRLRFHGDRPTGGRDMKLPATPTPWIVVPDTTWAPAKVFGSTTFNVGALTVEIDGPRADVPYTEPSPGRRRYMIPVFEMEQRKWGPEQPEITPPPGMGEDESG